MMPDSFFFSTNIENFLFYGANVQSKWGLLALFIGMASLSLLHQVLKSGHKICFGPPLQVIRKPVKFNEKSPLLPSQGTSTGSYREFYSPSPYREVRKVVSHRLCYHVLGTILYVLNVVLNYFIMLSVMTFNAYFIFAAVLGSGLGYLCFGFLNLPLFPNTRSERNGPTRYGTSDAGEGGSTSLPVDQAGPSQGARKPRDSKTKKVTFHCSSDEEEEQVEGGKEVGKNSRHVQVEVHPSEHAGAVVV